MNRIGACYKKKEYGDPKYVPPPANGGHPLPAALRQVGAAHEGAARGSGGGGGGGGAKKPAAKRAGVAAAAAAGGGGGKKRAKTMDDFVTRS